MTWANDVTAIEAHYQDGVEERRIATIARFEFLRTREILGRYLPPAPATIADVGGGPGTYALPLAAEGYAVRLIDPVAVHVEHAQEGSARQPGSQLESAVVGDARQLPWGDSTVDACLYFGPMYHLTVAAERQEALAEARRVLRPGGLLMATAISRFVSVYAGLVRGFLADPAFRAIAASDLRDGQHRNPNRDQRWFTTAYYHRPEGFTAEIEHAGFRVQALLAVDGPAGCLNDLGSWLDSDDRRETLLSVVREVESEPSLLGASPQLLAVAARPL